MKVDLTKIRYYDVSKNWTKKIEPLLTDSRIMDVLVRDFNKFTKGTWKKPFKHGDLPADFENCDWKLDRRGRQPRFWQYVKHAACHWLVNFNLKLAEAVEPTKEWRILTSDLHSTVFDGVDTLFDMNFLALGVSPQDSYKLATSKKDDPEELAPGKERKTYMAIHYSKMVY
jgi:hypothetical protein